jgi:hypothetical protein
MKSILHRSSFSHSQLSNVKVYQSRRLFSVLSSFPFNVKDNDVIVSELNESCICMNAFMISSNSLLFSCVISNFVSFSIIFTGVPSSNSRIRL